MAAFCAECQKDNRDAAAHKKKKKAKISQSAQRRTVHPFPVSSTHIPAVVRQQGFAKVTDGFALVVMNLTAIANFADGIGWENGGVRTGVRTPSYPSAPLSVPPSSAMCTDAYGVSSRCIITVCVRSGQGKFVLIRCILRNLPKSSIEFTCLSLGHSSCNKMSSSRISLSRR